MAASKPVYEGMGRRSKYGLLDDQNIMDYVDSLGPSAKLGTGWFALLVVIVICVVNSACD